MTLPLPELAGETPIDRPTPPREAAGHASAHAPGLAQRDAAALTAFYNAWFQRAFGLATSLTRRDEAFCLDVVQDAFLRVIKTPPRSSASEEELDRWMARVVHTAAIDRLRRDSRRKRREERWAMRDGADAPGRTDDAAAAEERIQWIRQRLAELDASDRLLLDMRLARGASLDRAGAAAGISGDAAHGRIRRALLRLRTAAQEIFHGRH